MCLALPVARAAARPADEAARCLKGRSVRQPIHEESYFLTGDCVLYIVKRP